MSKRLFVDMDGTLARFHDQVNFLERMWEPGFFRNLEPFDNMLYGLKDFIGQHPDIEVFILSSKILGEPPYCEMEKNDWLDKYLPEVDAEHRIFPAVGVSKASCIEGGITKDDYLLDDYNKSLREWEAAGGHAVKCHNNINQHGLGAYGGGRGELWMGEMVHTTDRPAMISAELSQHMELDYDLHDVARSYGMLLHSYPAEPSSLPYEWYKDVASGNWRAEPKLDHWRSEHVYTNPLNAIRSCVGKREFDELPVDFKKEGIRMTKAELADFAANNYVSGAPEYDAPSFEWETFTEETRAAVAAAAEAESVESAEDYETLRQQAERDEALDEELVDSPLLGDVDFSYYDYNALRAKASSGEQKDLDALGKWFEHFGDRYWNGEYFDADGIKLFPVHKYNEQLGILTVVGYSTTRPEPPQTNPEAIRYAAECACPKDQHAPEAGTEPEP